MAQKSTGAVIVVTNMETPPTCSAELGEIELG